VSEMTALVFLMTGQLLLLVAVMCFGVGRMEVGDEMWHLKRVVPFLRPFDQTLPYLVALAAGWWLVVDRFYALAATVGSPPGLKDIFVWVSITSFAALCAAARLATAISVGRAGAGTITASVGIGLWFVLPLVGIAIRSLSPAFAPVGEYFVKLSPFVLLFNSVGEPLLYQSFGDLTGVNGLVCVSYVAGTVVLVIVGEYKRWQRWKGFDYHYDMPARA